MPVTQVGDIAIYFEEGGNPAGPPVLTISGTAADLRQEPNQLQSPLAADFRLLAYDQRGLGRSGKPDVPYWMDDYARDAVGLLDALGWDRCSVVGLSFGGMVAQELALLAPERIDRLVLCCTSSGGAGGASYPLHELESVPPDQRLGLSLGLLDTRWGTPGAPLDPAIVDAVAAAGSSGSGDPAAAMGARRQLEARAIHDTYDRLPSLTMPTLVCGGYYDGIAPPRNSEALAAAIPGAVLKMFDGGHAFLLQHPQAWSTIIEFLADGRAVRADPAWNGG